MLRNAVARSNLSVARFDASRISRRNAHDARIVGDRRSESEAVGPGASLIAMTRAGLIECVDAALPQTQCTRCGYPTCRAYAQAIVGDIADIDRCAPGGADGVAALARVLGRASKPLNPDYGSEVPPHVVFIDEDVCIGCTKCIQACPVDAIVGAAKRMHTIIAAECTGCGLCLPPCPVDCIALLPIAPAPLARAQILVRAAQARTRFDARNERMELALVVAASTSMSSRQLVASTAAEAAPTTDASIAAEAAPTADASIATGAAPTTSKARLTVAEDAPAEKNARGAAPPISRNAVLEAIARGKARRNAAGKEPSKR